MPWSAGSGGRPLARAPGRGLAREPLFERSADAFLEGLQRRERLLLVVEESERVADQRRGDGGAEAAMLDDRRGRVARVVERRRSP